MGISEDWQVWVKRCEWIVTRLRAKGATISEFKTGPVTSQEELTKIEKEIGRDLPVQVKKFASSCCSEVRIDWCFLDNSDVPQDLRLVRYGRLEFSLEDVSKEWHFFRDMIASSSKVSDDLAALAAYLPVIQVPNGDIIAVGSGSGDSEGMVVYLDHELGYCGEGEQRIGTNFLTFIGNFLVLGCPGPENHILGKFLSKDTGMLVSDNDFAIRWLQWLSE